MHLLRQPLVRVGLVVLVVAFAGLLLTHHRAPLAVSAGAARRDALRDARVRDALRNTSWNRVRVTRVDDRLVRVSFFAGDRIVFDAGVTRDGRVAHAAALMRNNVGYGATLSHDLAVLVVMLALFVATTAVRPLRHVRNLDVLALGSFAAGVFVLDRGELEAFVLLAAAPLLYLAVRCGVIACGGSTAPPATALLASVLPQTRAGDGARLVRLGLVGAVLAYLIVVCTSSGIVDVGYASLAGATDILHGTLPYGHLPPDVVHGDTYPVLAYLAYVPAALIDPVRDGWDSQDGALWLAAAATLCTAFVLARGLGRRPGDRATIALAWLTFPPLLVTASSGTNDLILAALLALALLLTRRRGVLAVVVLAIAAWVKILPVLLLPIWLARLRGRDLRRALAGVGAVSVACGAALFGLGGLPAFGAMLHGLAFQWERDSLHSLWAWFHLPGGQAFVQAATLVAVAVGTLGVRRSRALASDTRRLAALAAVILIGLQLGGNYWAYLYLSWLFPCLAWALLRPAPSSEPASDAKRAAPARPGPIVPVPG